MHRSRVFVYFGFQHQEIKPSTNVSPLLSLGSCRNTPKLTVSHWIFAFESQSSSSLLFMG